MPVLQKNGKRGVSVRCIVQEFSKLLKPCLEKLASRRCHLIPSQHLSRFVGKETKGYPQ